MYSEFFLTMRILPCWVGVAYRKQISVKMLINLHLLSTKTASSSVIHIGTTVIFAGILEGVWPINNRKKIRFRDFGCLRKRGIAGLFKDLHYGIYKPSQ